MYILIIILGIVNLILVLIQLLSGLKVIRISIKNHRFFGIALAVGAFIHGLLALYINFF
ncbi:MAG: hypothetical protein JSV24_01220 [Bacteroidales bacterium]|nr:MAG: hypothetical protein JSV24_01220 [Bacteroidales bacterium]